MGMIGPQSSPPAGPSVFTSASASAFAAAFWCGSASFGEVGFDKELGFETLLENHTLLESAANHSRARDFCLRFPPLPAPLLIYSGKGRGVLRLDFSPDGCKLPASRQNFPMNTNSPEPPGANEAHAVCGLSGHP